MMQYTDWKTARIATTLVLLGVILIVTHVVAPTARAHTRAFSRGHVQPDLVSHVYKHIHKTAHAVSKKKHAKHRGAEAKNHRKHTGKTCASFTYEFVCPSRDSVGGEQPASAPSPYDAETVAAILAPLRAPFASRPPPRLPNDDKVRLLI